MIVHIVRFKFSELTRNDLDPDLGYVIYVDESRRMWIAESGKYCSFDVILLFVKIERDIFDF